MRNKYNIMLFSLFLIVANTNMLYIFNDFYVLKTPPKAETNKVCLVIVDGLRYDTSLKMPFINASINKNGILYKAKCSVPTKSKPGYERILTGSDTFINGIDSNFCFIPSLIPSIFSLAKEKHLVTASSSYYWIRDMFPNKIDYGYYYNLHDGKVFSKALYYIKNNSPDFIVIHPMIVDNAGHKYGGISNEYLQSAITVDNEIKELWDTLYDKNYILIVTSDHGQKDEGNHGDGNIKCLEIPIFITGSQFKNYNFKNATKEMSQIDIAPTICDILGISKTIFMTGDSLIESNDIEKIRNIYSTLNTKNYNSYFKITSLINYIILSLYTSIYMACCFIIIKLFKAY